MQLLRILPRFQRAYRELSLLAEHEQWTRGEIETCQLERLNAIWAHARLYVPHYRDLARTTDLPDRWQSLAEFNARMPLLTRCQVQGRERRFLSERCFPGNWGRTGGSTGEPLNVYLGAEGHREGLRAKYRFLDSWGIDPLERMAYLWGHAGSFRPGWRGWWSRTWLPIKDWLRNRLRLSAYAMGRTDLQGYLRRLEAFRPASLYAYSTAAFLLAQEAGAAGFTCPSLKLAILSSEPAYPRLVRTIEQSLHVPAAVEYGSIECGLIATEGPDRQLRVREDIVHVETLLRDDDRHDIVVTPLANPSFPLLRYAIGDVSDEPLRVPETGFAVLHNVGGRENDLLVSRSGRVIHPCAVEVLFERNGGPGVRRFFVEQDATGTLHVQVEEDAEQGSVPVEALRQVLSELLEGYHVQLSLTPTIPPTLAGKHRWIRSARVEQPEFETEGEGVR